MNIKELGDAFPETQISAQLYDMGNHTVKIREIAQKINILMNSAKKSANVLVEILRLRQALELHKLETIFELAYDGVEEGNSIVVMLNFNESVDEIQRYFNDKGIEPCIIRGGQTPQERQENIDKFQSNQVKVMICNIKSGGVGISLHDTDGDHPRLCLISPSYSAQDIIQAVGRVWRAGGKSKSIQKIVYCADTIEESICSKLSQKINTINIINEGTFSEIFDEFSSTF